MRYSKVINAHKKSLLDKPGVVGVWEGHKTVRGIRTKVPCVVVGVEKKLPLEKLAAENVIPQTLSTPTDVVGTDVVEVGKLVAGPPPEEVDPTDKVRPPQPGCSIGNVRITAGTFGLRVFYRGKSMYLSNWHVLAGSPNAVAGERIVQPGVYDGGIETVARLHSWVPMIFDGAPPPDPPTGCSVGRKANRNLKSRMTRRVANLAAAALGRKTRLAIGPNLVDAAIAMPDEGFEPSGEILVLGHPAHEIVDPYLGMPTHKSGRTTRVTEGEVVGINAVLSIDYGSLGTAIFEQQTLLSGMSQPGDSGSCILEKATNRPTLLLFAGSDTVTVGCSMRTVCNLLGVQV